MVMTRHDELRKHIEYQLLAAKLLKLEISACKRLIANFQREIDTEADYEINREDGE